MDDVRLNIEELASVGVMDQMRPKGQSKFVAAGALGLPTFGHNQMINISKMLTEKAKDLTPEQMDELILAEAS